MSITLSVLASVVLMASTIRGVSMAQRSPRWNTAGVGWLASLAQWSVCMAPHRRWGSV